MRSQSNDPMFRRPRAHRFHRAARTLASVFLAGVLAATQAVFAHAAETSFWVQRAEASRRWREGCSSAHAPGNPSLLALLSPASGPVACSAPSPLRATTPAFSGPALPLARALSVHGVVNDVMAGRLLGPRVVHIQDVHGLGEAQRNIGRIALQALQSAPDAVLVLEGGAGPIPTDVFRSANRENSAGAAAFFLNVGILSGGEYAAVAGGSPARGAEDPALYRMNVKAVTDAGGLKDRWPPMLAEWGARLEGLKKTIYGPDPAELDRREQSWDSDAGSLSDKIEFLTGHPQAPPLTAWPEIRRYREALAYERSLDPARVEREREEFLRALGDRLPSSETEVLARAALDLRSGQVRPGEFYALLRRAADGQGVSLAQRPAFDAYVRYVGAADAIRPERLEAELAELADVLWARLCRTEEEKFLRSLTSDFRLLRDLSRLSLTPHEWADYLARREQIRRWPGRLASLEAGPFSASGWTSLLEPFEAFYRAAEARNRAIAENVLRAGEGGKTVVLVAGGYHAAGLAPCFHQAGASVLTVSPKLGAVEGVPGAFDMFTRERTPLERLFSSPRIGLAPPLALQPLIHPAVSENPVSRLAPTVVEALDLLSNDVDGRALATQATPDGGGVVVEARVQERPSVLEHPGQVLLSGLASLDQAGKDAPVVEVIRRSPSTWRRAWNGARQAAIWMRRASRPLLTAGLLAAMVLPLSPSPVAHAAVYSMAPAAVEVVLSKGGTLSGVADAILRAQGVKPSAGEVQRIYEKIGQANRVSPGKVQAGVPYVIPTGLLTPEAVAVLTAGDGRLGRYAFSVAPAGLQVTMDPGAGENLTTLVRNIYEAAGQTPTVQEEVRAVKWIVQANKIKNPDRVRAGRAYKIPPELSSQEIRRELGAEPAPNPAPANADALALSSPGALWLSISGLLAFLALGTIPRWGRWAAFLSKVKTRILGKVRPRTSPGDDQGAGAGIEPSPLSRIFGDLGSRLKGGDLPRLNLSWVRGGAGKASLVFAGIVFVVLMAAALLPLAGADPVGAVVLPAHQAMGALAQAAHPFFNDFAVFLKGQERVLSALTLGASITVIVLNHGVPGRDLKGAARHESRLDDWREMLDEEGSLTPERLADMLNNLHAIMLRVCNIITCVFGGPRLR